jgi:hypothetical protein
MQDNSIEEQTSISEQKKRENKNRRSERKGSVSNSGGPRMEQGRTRRKM